MVSKHSKKNKQSLFFSVALLAALLFVVGFLVFTNWKVSQKRERMTARIEMLKNEINKLESKNEQMREEISESGTPEHLERVAREDLGLKVSGEEVVIINNQDKNELSHEEEGKKPVWDPRSWWEWLIK